ncbi:MAG: PfkB family carbohydrate kinase [Opitutales bacterium]
MPRILNIGSLNIDRVYRVESFTAPGQTQAAAGFSEGVGGKGLNQSVALGRAGAAVSHLGFTGPEGRFLVDCLREAGVDVDPVGILDAQPSGHAVIEVDDSGENRIIIVPGANHELTDAAVASALEAVRPDWVLLQNETNRVAETLAQAADTGARVCFNAAPAPAADLAGALPLDRLHVLVVNRQEMAVLSGEADADASLKKLRKRFPRLEIVLTLGGAGARVAGPDGEADVDAFAVEPVDTTGAGDTFTGYFLQARADGQAPSVALRRAAAAAALSVARAGAAASIPTASEVDSFLSRHP